MLLQHQRHLSLPVDAAGQRRRRHSVVDGRSRRGDPRRWLVRGVRRRPRAASMAILTRPNLVPLAVVIALFVVWQAARADRGDRRRHLHRLSAFLIGMAPGCLGVAAFNQYCSGSFSFQSRCLIRTCCTLWSHVLPNLRLYPHWLVETSAAFIFVALAAPWFVRKRDVTALPARVLGGRGLRVIHLLCALGPRRMGLPALRAARPFRRCWPPGAAVLVDAAKRISNRTEIAAAVALAFLGARHGGRTRPCVMARWRPASENSDTSTSAAT